MTLSEQRLAYCDLLNALMRRLALTPYGLVGERQARFHNLCDRFERALASVDIEPLVWEGDYA